MTKKSTPAKQKKGFALMSSEEVKRIAAMGGRAIPPELRAFSRDRELASAAGRKGGAAVPASLRTYNKDRELAAAAGRKGGAAKKKLMNV